MKQCVGILIATGLLSACGSLKTRSVDPAQLKEVRKVAIASFSVTQPPPGGGQADLIAHKSEEAAQTYTDVVQTLQTKMKWSVVGLDQLRANAEYKKVHDGKMKGWQNKAPMPGKHFIVDEIMDAQSLRRMKPEEKDALMSALGVDALMETQVNVRFATKGVAVMGIGDRYPQATVSFWLYKKGVAAPVWFEGNLQGDPASQSVGKTAFWDENEVSRLGRLSARNAFSKIDAKQE